MAAVTYAELLAVASAGAAELAARGAGPGQRVAIALPPGLAFAQALHACLLLGAVAVPVDLRLIGGRAGADHRRRRRAASRSLCRTEARPAGATGADRYAGARHDLDDHGRGDPHLRHHLCSPSRSSSPTATSSGARSARPSRSDSTRASAGCARCRSPMSAVSRSCCAPRSTRRPRLSTSASTPTPCLHALREQDITLVSVVATTLARLLDAMPAHPERPPALRCALTGGGPVPPALVSRARAAGVPVSLTYGLTEACSQVTTTPAAELDVVPHGAPTHPLSAGPPLFCTRVRIATDGEILVAGPTVAPGGRRARRLAAHRRSRHASTSTAACR